MIIRYLKGFYIRLLAFVAKIFYWLTLLFSFGQESLFFKYEEWILFLLYSIIIWNIMTMTLKEIEGNPLEEDKGKAAFRKDSMISNIVIIAITIVLVALMVLFKNYEGVLLIILMNSLAFKFHQKTMKQLELKSMKN